MISDSFWTSKRQHGITKQRYCRCTRSSRQTSNFAFSLTIVASSAWSISQFSRRYNAISFAVISWLSFNRIDPPVWFGRIGFRHRCSGIHFRTLQATGTLSPVVNRIGQPSSLFLFHRENPRSIDRDYEVCVFEEKKKKPNRAASYNVETTCLFIGTCPWGISSIRAISGS